MARFRTIGPPSMPQASDAGIRRLARSRAGGVWSLSRHERDASAMIPTAMALVMAAPAQLAAVAGVELSGGYDSTVLNPTTQVFGDGGLFRLAVDTQVGHRTETLRQT